MKEFDVIIVGAGVIGCSTAAALGKGTKKRRVAVIEKEKAPALHTSGRNSGVVHAGFNPKPGTRKASFCVEGNRRMTEFCQKHGIPFSPVGTLVVALEPKEIPTLEELHRRGVANGVPGIRLIDGVELRRLEPFALGIAALQAPTGSITASSSVTGALAEEAKQAGCEFYFASEVIAIEEKDAGIFVRTPTETFRCAQLVNCGGLHADSIAHKMGVGLQYAIFPFRGEYYRLAGEHRNVLNSMLYPAPDINYPFLGVHWTKKITGETWIGPNATLAWGREAYGTLQIMPGDVLKMVGKGSFWKMFGKSDFRRLAWQQLRISLSRKRFVQEAQRLIPNVKIGDFTPTKSGIRAQLVNNNGDLIDDIVIEKQRNAVHVLNAVSPGFTCSIPFGEHLAGLLEN